MHGPPLTLAAELTVLIELAAISDEELASYIHEAWLLIAPKKLRALLADAL